MAGGINRQFDPFIRPSVLGITVLGLIGGCTALKAGSDRNTIEHRQLEEELQNLRFRLSAIEEELGLNEEKDAAVQDMQIP